MMCKCKEDSTRLRIEADFADPIWCDVCHCNFNLIDFPLSDNLVEEFIEWEKEYAKIFMLWEDEKISAEEKDRLLKKHNELGLELTEKTRNELGDKYVIRFVKAALY